MLQANRMSLLTSDDGGMVQTRVNVLPEMPLLEARLDAASLQLVDTEQAQVGLTVTQRTACQQGCTLPLVSALLPWLQLQEVQRARLSSLWAACLVKCLARAVHCPICSKCCVGAAALHASQRLKLTRLALSLGRSAGQWRCIVKPAANHQ